MLANLATFHRSIDARRWSATTTPRRSSTSSGPLQGTDLGLHLGADQPAGGRDQARPCRAARSVTVRGQIKTMSDSFLGLLVGLAGAVMLVYLLIVVNFQSWLRPVHHHHRPAGRARRHRLDAVPHAHAGERAGAHRARSCAWAWRPPTACWSSASRVSAWMPVMMRCTPPCRPATTRFRPVLMTALAMIIGMVPMALGSRRGRRAECAPRTRRDRRPAVRHRGDAVLRADGLLPHPLAPECRNV